MAKILVFTENHHHKIKSVTFEILKKLNGHQVDVLSFDPFNSDNQNELKNMGAQQIIHLKNAELNQYSPEGYASALTHFLKSHAYDYVCAGSTSATKDFFPRVSGELQTALVSDATSLVWQGDKLTGSRPLFSGKCLADFELLGPKPSFVTFRPNALGMDGSVAASEGKMAEMDAQCAAIRAKIKEVLKGVSEKIDLTEANIIVSGGRAMKNSDNFKILNELADVIGATVGASRAAVDSGFAPPAMQVGQTGKTVSPTLYIACGISGAIQHLAGMRTSKVIVAINTDPDAPIFAKADYGIVGDLFTIVPLLTQEFKKLLGK